MKKYFFLAFVLVGLHVLVVAQTQRIAFYSRGGNANQFVPNRNENFGIVPPRLMKVTKINPNTVVLQYDHHSHRNDTVMNDPIFCSPERDLKALRKIYPDIVFENFCQYPNPVAYKDSIPTKNPKQNPNQNKIPDQNQNPNQNQNSNQNYRPQPSPQASLPYWLGLIGIVVAVGYGAWKRDIV